MVYLFGNEVAWATDHLSTQGLEGYFRDPGLDQNTVRVLGKRKISWREKESSIHQNLGKGFGVFNPVCRDFGKSYVVPAAKVNQRAFSGVSYQSKL